MASDEDRPGLAPLLRALLVLGLLYLFLVGVGGIEGGIRHLGEGFQAGMLDSIDHPIAGLFAGILATVLVQSSSVSTATIVGLVGSGVIPVEFAVPMIMGANIGTTVTNTLVALGSLRRGEEFRRAFAGATVHDFFNVLAVAILLPVELLTRIFTRAAEWLSGWIETTGIVGVEARSPIRQAVKWGTGQIESLYEVVLPTDPIIGIALLLTGLGLILVALRYITRNMRELVAGRIERSMNRMIGRGGGAVAILIGIVVTVLVQSSSITTSILIPMLAAGVLTLRNAYPITLGANVGTTITALLAALAVDLPAGLVVALVHTLFNIAGIAIFYPVPALRDVPVRLAERLADVAATRPVIVVAYVGGLFIVVPLIGMTILG